MDRRRFLGSSASLLAAGIGTGYLGIAGSAFAQGRREVAVGGRRVTTVDVHAHTIIPEAAQLLGGAIPNNNPNLVVSQGRIDIMNRHGIDIEILSINPIWYQLGVDEARRFIDVQNRGLAAICRQYPDRLRSMATVALQHPELAAEQLEHGIKELGFVGVSMGGSVAGEELGSTRFDPFWAAVQALDVPLWLHPQSVPGLTRLQGNGYLFNVIGNPLDTTIALAHIIFEGVLDRFPRLKIASAHGGGYLASYADRADYGCARSPADCPKMIQRKPTEYLRDMYYDSLVFTSENLRHLVAQYGADHIMIGTDYPYDWVDRPVDHILETPGLSDADKIAI
ncbi:MAG TPA: amidohydrolase family protein, partial [Gammaproteobacteria bacterium]|nr:amidohydrolase family protein [Gammaproteobacteria bacterium]